MLSLIEVENEVNKIARKIDIYSPVLPTYGESLDFGHPHIEIDKNGYHYVIVERGKELLRKTTMNLDELLFTIFENVTNEIAFSYELKNRNGSEDCRIIAFKKQEELMTLLNPIWGEKNRKAHEVVLQKYPFIT